MLPSLLFLKIVLTIWCHIYVFCIYFIYFTPIFIGIQLLYKVVLVSIEQENESPIHIHICPPFWTSFSFRSPQCIKQSSLYCRACSHFLGGFPGGLDGKETACNAEDPGSVPGWENPLEKGMVNPLQHSCLENSTDRGSWPVTGHGVSKSQT